MALSAPLLSRLRVIKVAIETTKGTKVAGTQALRVFDLKIDPTSPFEERKGTGTMRGHEVAGVHGETSGKCSFQAELRATAGTPNVLEAGLAILLQACVFKQTVQVYQVHSGHSSDKTISIDVWEAGIKKSLAGCSGNVTFSGAVGKRMYLNFELQGRWLAPTDEAVPANAPSTAAPMYIQAATFTLGGEAIKFGNFSLDMGCDVVARMDADAAGGIGYYMIPDFDPTVTMDIEADLVAGYDFHGIKLARTTAAVSLALTDGTNIVTFTLPAVQIKELPGGERDGVLTYDYVGQCIQSAGNDAVAIAVT